MSEFYISLHDKKKEDLWTLVLTKLGQEILKSKDEILKCQYDEEVIVEQLNKYNKSLCNLQ